MKKKMLHSSLSFVFFISFFLILIPQHNCSDQSVSRHHPNPKHWPAGIDLVNATCELCANASASFRYNFCTSSLQSLPITRISSFRGLAIVAMELAMENASATVQKIADMMNYGSFDHNGMAWLGDCMEAYSHSVTALLNAIGEFTAEHYVIANAWMLQVTKGIRRCEVRFSRRGRDASPLNKHNYDALRLSAVVLCIIQFLEPT